MPLDYRNSWLRVLIEFLEPQTPIRRYRMGPPDLERATNRTLVRRIARQFRKSRKSSTP